MFWFHLIRLKAASQSVNVVLLQLQIKEATLLKPFVRNVLTIRVITVIYFFFAVFRTLAGVFISSDLDALDLVSTGS